MIKRGLFVFICLVSSLAFSQDDHDGNRLYDHDLDENKWEDIRNDIRYEGQKNGAGREWTYENQREYREAQKRAEENGNGNGSGGNGNGNGGNGTGGEGSGSSSKPSSSSPSSSSSRSSPSGGGAALGAFGYILLAVFLVGLVILIYFLFINAPKKGKKIKQTAILENVNPTEIPLTELQRLLKEAIAKGDYRGAVRIYFIFIIRDLAEKKWVNWEKEKTNFHYLREMSGKKEYDDFNRAVSFFEIIWYGKREIDQQKFNEIKPHFTRFLDKLGVK